MSVSPESRWCDTEHSACSVNWAAVDINMSSIVLEGSEKMKYK